jgi:sugar lactone lactonase YvrE
VTSPSVFPGRHRIVVACGAALGEGTLWDGRTGTLIFVDIRGHRVWRWQPDVEPVSVDVGEPVGFALLTSDPDRLLVGLKSGLARLDLRSGETEVVLRPEPELPGNRLNDAAVGPDGSLYFGSMDDGEAKPSGGFYHWSAGGLSSFGEKAVITNGPAIDPERGVLYCSDTPTGRVFRHKLGPDGVPGERELFVQFEEGWGHPDGMAVDAEGHVWICHFGDSRVTRFSPDGQPQLIVPVPTAQVTKPAFGGPDLTTLFVTTAAKGRDPEIDPMAGHVFAFDVGIRGLPAKACRILP